MGMDRVGMEAKRRPPCNTLRTGLLYYLTYGLRVVGRALVRLCLLLGDIATYVTVPWSICLSVCHVRALCSKAQDTDKISFAYTIAT